MSFKNMTTIEKMIVIGLFFFATIYILSGAYVGINGHHSWRQSDVYSHILGFMQYKNFLPYDKFFIGSQAVYDIPIYEWIIAKIALFIHIDSLVITTILNYIFWIITAVSGMLFGYKIGRNFAGIAFLFIFSTSPLILHYYSVPLPDNMSLALSMLTITILYSQKLTYKTAILVLPLIITATLIKSPVPFVFILFYTIFLLLEFIFNKTTKFIDFLKDNKLYLAISIVLVLTAITAEILRKYLLGNLDGVGFAQDPSWYFGNLDLRMSSIFWKTMYVRLSSSGLYNFALVYIIVSTLAMIVSRDKKLIAVTFAAILSFLIAWLTFSNVYRIHDYYELPVTVIMFLSFSISVSFLLNFVYSKFLKNFNQAFIKIVSFSLFVIITLHLLITQHYISDRHKTTFFSAVEEMLKHEELFLLVSKKPNGDPTIAGKVSTKVKTLSLEKFDNNCSIFLSKYNSFLINGYSQCMDKLKDTSNIVMKNGSYTFIQVDKNLVKLSEIRHTVPTIESTWNLYLEDKTLTYVKTPCDKKDTKYTFYLHVVPLDTSLKLNDGGGSFKNMDFKFNGLIKDDTCIVVKQLPEFQIKAIRTGQYSSYLDKEKKRKFKNYWKASISVE